MWGTKLVGAIDDVIAEVGLTEKRHTLSSALSGGMKRSVCYDTCVQPDVLSARIINQ